MSNFSRRNGYVRQPTEIRYREDAPETLRTGLLTILNENLKLGPSYMRDVVCRVLRQRPNPGNWSEYPNIWGEVEGFFYSAEWYQVYDFIEAFHEKLANEQDRFRGKSGRAEEFDARVNELFVEEGAGWQLEDGCVESRGDEAFESAMDDAYEAFEKSTHEVAAQELAEARTDLSRRPDPDLSGAIHHAMASLEAVAREMVGDRKATLGDIVKKYPTLFPKPVDEAVGKLWGFASENARHGRASRKISFEEAQLAVGTSAVLTTYLLGKHKQSE
jgi:hypothetical protein